MPDLPNVFDCGCSRFKVASGRCDVYAEDGLPRIGPIDPMPAASLAQLLELLGWAGAGVRAIADEQAEARSAQREADMLKRFERPEQKPPT